MTSAKRDTVVHVLPAKMGGVVTNAAALQARFSRSRFSHEAVLVHHTLSRDTGFEEALPVERQHRFEHSLPQENLYSVIRRLVRTIPRGNGVLIANDWLELAALCRYPTSRVVVQVLHGDSEYYLDLAAKHDLVVDTFVACSRRIHDALKEALPHRASDIHHVPHGIAVPSGRRQPVTGPLRLLYAGRLENTQKGIFDLPRIDEALRGRGIGALWTVVGGGPDESRLRSLWADADNVRWAGVLGNRQTVEVMSSQDVFVLPTRAEGFPIALLEAMARGLVPVVGDASSGVGELVLPGRTGFRVPIGDVRGFAEAIASLDENRVMVETLSRDARRFVEERFPIERQVEWYESFFSRVSEARKPYRGKVPLHYGSRLDKPWLPNVLVRLLRTNARWTSLRT